MAESQESVVCVIHSPLSGTVCSLDEVKDPAFSKRMIGDGVAVIPEEMDVIAPVSGKVVSVFETKHAVVFENAADVRVLLHIGIDSMRLQGEGFSSHVANGQQVQKGEKLLSLDLDYLKAHVREMMSPVVITESRQRFGIRVVAVGHVEIGDPLYEVYELGV